MHSTNGKETKDLILVVDDQTNNLTVISGALGKDYRLRLAISGAGALQILEKIHPDLILLDIMMPDMDGYEVCRRVKENDALKDIPIIFLTAKTEIEDVLRGFDFGAVDYITKPFNLNELKARIDTHLSLAWARKVITNQKIEVENSNALLQESEYHLKKANEDLLKANAEKDKFFSIIAHDLRSPFNGFFGLAEFMASKVLDLSMDEIHEYAVNMKDSATSLLRLLDNLLQWAQMQQGLIPFNPTEVQLLPAVQEGISATLLLARYKAIAIKVAINDEIKVDADVNMLQTVIRNLVSNAIKFTHRGGKIEISARINEKNKVIVSVKDTGIGMNYKLVNNLFRLDVKTNRIGTDGEPSTGLGLILCKDFIEKHGEKIWAKSEEAKGSRFSFTLPCCCKQV
jgi:signal transduction histidine kinase